MDLVADGLVSDVVGYQGNCAACAAFTKTKKLSVQHLVDCAEYSIKHYNEPGKCKRDNDEGKLLEFILRNGIYTEAAYGPFKHFELINCREIQGHAPIKDLFKIIYYVPNEEYAMKLVLNLYKLPLLAGIDVSSDNTFKFYASGVFYQMSGRLIRIHSVLIIGYGYDVVYGNYWIIKNSYGARWGMNGYMHVVRTPGINHIFHDKIFFADSTSH